MKKRRIDLTVKEQIEICEESKGCSGCINKYFCWDDFDEPISIATLSRKTNWLNEEIELPEVKECQ